MAVENSNENETGLIDNEKGFDDVQIDHERPTKKKFHNNQMLNS